MNVTNVPFKTVKDQPEKFLPFLDYIWTFMAVLDTYTPFLASLHSYPSLSLSHH